MNHNKRIFVTIIIILSVLLFPPLMFVWIIIFAIKSNNKKPEEITHSFQSEIITVNNQNKKNEIDRLFMSVTKRCRTYHQPYGGFIKPRDFLKEYLDDGKELNDNENIHPSVIGLTVDYLSRFKNDTPINVAFKISLMGAKSINKEYIALELINKIKGIDDESIINAVKLCTFDQYFRAGIKEYKDVDLVQPNYETIENIRVMVNRSLNFFRIYGPIIKDGFTFAGGYTPIIASGDGDFLSKDTLWDFKTSKKDNLTSVITLQLIVYYLMGMRSIDKIDFESITKLGVFNPRKNIVYTLEINKIDPIIIEEIRTNVIGYTNDSVKF